MRKWKCFFCNHIFDEAVGDPEHGIAAGTRFEDLPEDWYCPDCGVTKDDYGLLEG
jgi:rubredoxin-NAD+ reductase